MSKKNIATGLAVLLLIASFLPFISVPGYTFNEWHVIFGKDGLTGISTGGKFLYACLLIPIGAVMILLGNLTNTKFGTSTYPFWFPLAGIVILTIIMYSGMSKASLGNMSVGDYLKVMGYGYWITWIGAVLLPFYKTD